MAKEWIASVLRVRQLKEDVAKQRRAEAERVATRARHRTRYEAERLAEIGDNDEDSYRTVGAFIASSAALQSAAATYAAAVRAEAVAESEVGVRHAELGGAAMARRSAELLRDRELEEERDRAAASAQRELDEIAARIHRDAAEQAQ
jgi:hypothetical protein